MSTPPDERYGERLDFEPSLEFVLVLSWARNRFEEAVQKQRVAHAARYFVVASDIDTDLPWATYVLSGKKERQYRDSDVLEMSVPIKEIEIAEPQLSDDLSRAHFRVTQHLHGHPNTGETLLIDSDTYTPEATDTPSLPIPGLLDRLMSDFVVIYREL